MGTTLRGDVPQVALNDPPIRAVHISEILDLTISVFFLLRLIKRFIDVYLMFICK